MLSDHRFCEAISDLQKRFQHPVETPLKPDERLQSRSLALAACTQEGFELPQEVLVLLRRIYHDSHLLSKTWPFLACGMKKAGQVKSAEGVQFTLDGLPESEGRPEKADLS
jgi:hypothetical protein